MIIYVEEDQVIEYLESIMFILDNCLNGSIKVLPKNGALLTELIGHPLLDIEKYFKTGNETQKKFLYGWKEKIL